jgi:hypothetical protein
MKYLIIFSTISLLFNSCIKEKCQINGGHYEFEIPATLTPAKDTFQVGDTITIVSSFPDEVYERKTDKTYKLENFSFYPGTEIVKIDSSVAIPAIVNYFDLLIDTAQDYHLQVFSSGTHGIIGQYQYINNNYSLNFKIIAKRSGLFYMEQGVALNLAPNQDFEGKCSNLRNDAAVILNGGADNNIEMLKYSPDPHYNDWILQKPEDRFYKFGGYCFYVRE